MNAFNNDSNLREWNKDRVKYIENRVPKNQLVMEGNWDAAPPNSYLEHGTKGALMFEIPHKPGWYEYDERVTVKAPWLGQPMEGTYMNSLKRHNEPPVLTYRDLEFTPIPANDYGNYKPAMFLDEPGIPDVYHESCKNPDPYEHFGGSYIRRHRRGNSILKLILLFVILIFIIITCKYSY